MYKKMVLVLFIIITTQSYGGNTCIKIGNVAHKWVVEIMYVLCYLFDKINIVKLSISDILDNHRYLICTNFLHDSSSPQIKLIQNSILEQLFIIYQTNVELKSILSNNIPCHILNKIDESNVVIGQQQLESIDQLCNILKNKNKDDKVEILKNTNTIKCNQWICKYLPNIFSKQMGEY